MLQMRPAFSSIIPLTGVVVPCRAASSRGQGIRHGYTAPPLRRREMRRRMVTVVPFPGTERTRRLSIKLSIMVRPCRRRYSSPVVKSGSLARSTSSMPTPQSRMTISSTLSAKIRSFMDTLPRGVRVGMDNGVGHRLMTAVFTSFTSSRVGVQLGGEAGRSRPGEALVGRAAEKGNGGFIDGFHM